MHETKNTEKSEEYLIRKAKEAACTEDENVAYVSKVTENLIVNRFQNHSLTVISRFLRIKAVQFKLLILLHNKLLKKNVSQLLKKCFSQCKISNHTLNECRRKPQLKYAKICS